MAIFNNSVSLPEGNIFINVYYTKSEPSDLLLFVVDAWYGVDI